MSDECCIAWPGRGKGEPTKVVVASSRVRGYNECSMTLNL
jgi:hypothetical protein